MNEDVNTTTAEKEKEFSFIALVKELPTIIIFIIIALLCIAIFVNVGYAFFKAKEIGGGIGSAAGTTAGKFTGSYEGITQGLAKGAAEGKEDGLSAQDTEVDIGNRVVAMGNLEVLSASVVMHDLLEISDKNKALLAFYGDITFTVDLSEAEIKIDDNKYTVNLPMPVAKLRIDDKKSEQLASYMKHSWSGSNEDGYTAVMNSIKELTINAEETVTNYKLLRDSAEESAKKQVTFLIQSATNEGVNVDVKFKESSKEE